MRILFILICIVGFGINKTSAQCCAAGNPVNTDFNIGQTSNSLTISTAYKHSLSTDYYTGSTLDPDYHYLNKTYLDFQSVEASYQYKKLGVKALVGYFYNKNRQLEGGYEPLIDGWGDLSLGISYNVSDIVNNKLTIIPNLGVILPTGEFNVTVGGIKQPIDFQPSAGSMHLNGGFLLAKGFLNSKLNVFSYNFMEYAYAVTDRTEEYKYGNLYVNSIGASYPIKSWITPSVQLRSEYREKAKNVGVIQDGTGGHNIFVALKASGSHGDFSANIGFDVPVYKNVNGQQMTNKYIVSVGVGYRINFSKISHSINALEVPIDKDLKNIDIKVRGLCGMCKDRIESVALNVKNIKFAQYDLASQTLSIQYKKELNINRLFEGLSSAGHDNEFMKASSEAYENLHECCRYKR